MVNLIQIAPPKNAPPTFAMSRQKAAELLGISVDSVAFLLKSRYLPDLDAGRLIKMANQPWLYSDGDFPVLQQRIRTCPPRRCCPHVSTSARAQFTPTPNAWRPTRGGSGRDSTSTMCSAPASCL